MEPGLAVGLSVEQVPHRNQQAEQDRQEYGKEAKKQNRNSPAGLDLQRLVRIAVPTGNIPTPSQTRLYVCAPAPIHALAAGRVRILHKQSFLSLSAQGL